MKFFRQSFVLKVSLSFLLGYAALDLLHFVTTNLLFYEEFQRKRMIEVKKIAQNGHIFLKHGEADYFIHELKDAKRLHALDFYLLKENDKPLAFESTGPTIQQLNSWDTRDGKGEWQLYGSAPHFAFQDGPYFIAVGVNQSRTQFIKLLFEKDQNSLILDIVIVVLMSGGIAFFYFGDVRAILSAIQSSDKGKLKSLKPTIAEAELVVRGLKTLDQELSKERLERGFLSMHVASAIRHELQSGKNPPYQFRCTMVRTDINHYSTIMAEQPVEEFMAIINEFFSRASNVIARYNGFITEFIGDEIVYYFKSEDHDSDKLIALAAIRDINAIADSIHERCTLEKGYPFRVKSAVADGNLRFGPHVSGFGLSGAAFVETVRILSKVDEKKDNSIYAPSRLTHNLAPLCLTEERMAVELKGIPGTTFLHRITRFTELGEILASKTHAPHTLVTCFRSPESAAQILRYIAAAKGDLPKLLYRELCKVNTPYHFSEIGSEFKELLNAHRHDPVLISQVIAGARKLISKNSYPKELGALLRSFLKSDDPRTIANTLDTLIYFEAPSSELYPIDLSRHSDNRVRANAIVLCGITRLSSEVLSGLSSLLEATEPTFIASGLYALATLAKYYRETNAVALQTNPEFTRILSGSKRYLNHDSPMVRAQAAKAYREYSDLSLVA